MASTFKNNAYHILGLDTSASEKDILKRSKEVINRLMAGDSPAYDIDIGLFKDFRTEDTVRDALQRLQSSKKRIKEYFFWFQIADDVDEKALDLIKNKDYPGAIEALKEASVGQNIKALLRKKNLAILYCLALFADGNKEYLQDSLATWKELVDSSKFWASFSKLYKLHDEQTASEEVLSDFKKHVVEYLSDIYTELHSTYKGSDYINEFQKVFSAKGEKIEKGILAPAYQTITQAVGGLEKMRVSEDGIFSKGESDTIKGFVSTIQQELNNLMDLGLYEDSQTKIMRDRAAVALRSIVMDLHNNLNELDKSKALLEVATQLAGTESMKNQLIGELGQIEKNIIGDAENSVVIDIPGTFQGGSVVFKNNFLDYNGRRILYKDATSISFHSTIHTTSVYGVKVSTSYTYGWSVASEKEYISLNLSASKDASREKDAWVKLVGLASNLIEPLIIKRIVDKMFNRGDAVNIGGVEFTKQGYSKVKFKLFGPNEKIMVNWTDPIYIPKLHQGTVILWQDNGGKGKQFVTIAISVPNAVVLPGLIQACIDRARAN